MAAKLSAGSPNPTGSSEAAPTRKRKSRFDIAAPNHASVAVPPPLPPMAVDDISYKRPRHDDTSGSSLDAMNSYVSALASQNTGEARQSVPRSSHIGSHLAPEELDRFLKQSRGEWSEDQDTANKLDATNKGHQMLKKLGWKEGRTLGRNDRGLLAPIRAGGVGAKGSGIGADTAKIMPVSTEDPYTLYKKRMALSYQKRPNPMGNPRTKYWNDATMNKGATLLGTKPQDF